MIRLHEIEAQFWNIRMRIQETTSKNDKKPLRKVMWLTWLKLRNP